MNSIRLPAVLSLATSSLASSSLAAEFAAVRQRVTESPYTLLVCKIIIGVVSAYDIHQTIKYVEYLPEMELNPIGRWLMSLDDGPRCDLQQAACFITLKFGGNFACLAVIEFVSSWNRALATTAALMVATFQMWLLFFLLFCCNT